MLSKHERNGDTHKNIAAAERPRLCFESGEIHFTVVGDVPDARGHTNPLAMMGAARDRCLPGRNAIIVNEFM